MTRSKSNQFHSRIILLTVLAALVIAGPAFSQNAVPERGYSTVDLTTFFGAQWYQIYQGTGGTGSQHFLEPRPVVGERLTFNPLNYVGFEVNWALGFNRLALVPAGSTQFASISARNSQYSYDTLFYFTKREALFRPYVLIGVGATDYVATGSVKYIGPPPLLPATFSNQWTGGLVYGLGTQVNVRGDLRFARPVPAHPRRHALYQPRSRRELSGVHDRHRVPFRIPRAACALRCAAASTAATAAAAREHLAFGDSGCTG
jgi:hypothetical protein